ncbi:MAG: urease accessory protein UreD [Hyphomicrobiales bacterium]|nr:urease accessory protein UreD [Hyphomicrobiales bacterium]
MTDLPTAVEAPGDARARQRADAHARASFVRTGSRTEPERLFETGGLRWRFPRSTSPCEAVIVNTAGGVAGGDAYRIEVALKEGAEVEATTTAAEKIYRTDAARARIETRLSLAPRTSLFWLPQETLLFDGAGLERRLAVEMAGDASLILVESLVFGRLARGESRIEAGFRDSWRIRRDGRLVFADETRLAHAGAALDRMAVGAGARALAAIVAAAPGVEARLRDLRAALETASEEVEAGASAFDGLIVARFLSASPARLRGAVIASILALGRRRPPRLWQ